MESKNYNNRKTVCLRINIPILEKLDEICDSSTIYSRANIINQAISDYLINNKELFKK